MEEAPAEHVPKSNLEDDFRLLSLMWEDYESPKGEMTLEEVAGKVNHIYRCDWPSSAGRRPAEISTKAILKALESNEECRKLIVDCHTESDKEAKLSGMIEAVLYRTVKEAIDQLSDVISEKRRIG
jgi:hypothetical protein